MAETDAIISFNFAGLPPNYCFTTWDRFALDLAAGFSGYLPGSYSTIIKSDTPPAAADRGKDWHKLDGLVPTGRIYSWYSGKWVSAHRILPPSKERIWWTGTEAELWAYDGGDGTDPSIPASAPTITTGAMWEVDEDYSFRFMLGAGTSPAPFSTTVSPGDVGGEEKHTLALDEMPYHGHEAFVAASDGNLGVVKAGLQTTDGTTGGGVDPAYLNQTGVDPYIKPAGGDVNNATVAHQNLPPYRVGIVAKRTARIFYTS